MTLVMGILNLTPDSFSDGGLWLEPSLAIAHATQMWNEGAAVIDVGAESTRPGATRITAAEELSRLAPVLPALVDAGITVSVDTVNAATALWALQSGATIINDISGGRLDPEMAGVVADSSARFVVQHWRGMPSDPNLDQNYACAAQVLEETMVQVSDVLDVGVRSNQIIIDPGLGFAKDADTSWEVLEDIESWVRTGYPVLVGASRKRFIRARYGKDIEAGTRQVTKLVAEKGVWAVRVHDVPGSIETLGEGTRQGRQHG